MSEQGPERGATAHRWKRLVRSRTRPLPVRFNITKDAPTSEIGVQPHAIAHCM